MLYRFFFVSVFLIYSNIACVSQVSINTDGTAPDASSILELKSNTKGFLPPRMTTAERDAIASPSTGLTVYVTDGSSPGYYQFNGARWISNLNLYDSRSTINCYLYNTATVSTVKIQEGTSYTIPSGTGRKKIVSVIYSTHVSTSGVTIRCRMYKISSGGILGTDETLLHTNQITSTSASQYLRDDDTVSISVSSGDIIFFDLITPSGSSTVSHGAVTLVFEDNP